jgi:4-hydroxybenzoyl-CoA reductase subunit beta
MVPMMRLPRFRYHAPLNIQEAAGILADAGPEALLLSGGTDLLPNMKRRQQVPAQVIGLRRIRDMKTASGNGDGLHLGAGMTLTAVARDEKVRAGYTALWQAMVQIATPHLRNMGTLGGNICLDTRCHYYDQNYEWRKAIDFCMKKDGETCWVAPGSKICLAVSSSDGAPALMALGATVRLVSSAGERTLPITDLYAADGINYLTRRPDEILTGVDLPPATGWRSAYWKLRRRGAFDFPVLSVAAAARLAGDGTVEEARLVLGAVSMRPQEAVAACDQLVGRKLTDDVIAETAEQAARLAKPMDNTDFALHWRKRVARHFVTYALQEVRGDDVGDLRRRVAHNDPATTQ